LNQRFTAVGYCVCRETATVRRCVVSCALCSAAPADHPRRTPLLIRSSIIIEYSSQRRLRPRQLINSGRRGQRASFSHPATESVCQSTSSSRWPSGAALSRNKIAGFSRLNPAGFERRCQPDCTLLAAISRRRQSRENLRQISMLWTLNKSKLSREL